MHIPSLRPPSLSFFFFNDTATTEIYTLSLHDALPISAFGRRGRDVRDHEDTELRAHPSVTGASMRRAGPSTLGSRDRKSTRLNSSHVEISYAVFCLKKKKRKKQTLSSFPLKSHQDIHV